jgi:hypothetical protein
MENTRKVLISKAGSNRYGCIAAEFREDTAQARIKSYRMSIHHKVLFVKGCTKLFFIRI